MGRGLSLNEYLEPKRIRVNGTKIRAKVRARRQCRPPRFLSGETPRIMPNDIEGRPFEMAIVLSIREARTQQQLAFCAAMIKRTTLRLNHDEIAAAWKQALAETGIRDPSGGDFGVREDVITRRQRDDRSL
jgi:hypothetical protein